MRIFVIAVALAIGATASHAQDISAGEKVFKRCLVCHVADKEINKVGPTLFRLNGRAAGTLASYKFSPAMIEAGKAGLVWDDKTLAQYLRDPKAMVKGTRMAFAGLKKDKEIADVIAYIDQFK
ncbi:MAG: cytochrome c family protein [Rhizobiaceae bacterium]|nr:cytochrome c family protein [Rhizobiaceae bacterium]